MSVRIKQLYHETDLKYYKKHETVMDPIFATDQSACFDLHAHFSESIRVGVPAPRVVVYTMENKKEERECTMKAKTNSTFAVGIDILPAERVLVPTGLIFNIPENHSVRLHTRSSVSLKRGLIMPNGEGIIDSDYYHEVFVMLYNASADTVRIEHGERICQGELVSRLSYSLEETPILPEQTTNRVGGFGSTGVK